MAPGTIHPVHLREQLADLRFHPDEQIGPEMLPFVPRFEEIDQSKDRRLASCLKIFCEATSIHTCATDLIEHQPWDFAAIYYDAIDHFGHGFMKYHPPRQKRIKQEDFELYKNVVTAGYIYHDMMLRRLLELAGSDTTVIVVSDHGFHPDHLRPASIPREPAGPAIEHREFGIFVMKGPGIRRDERIHGASLLDITPTLLSLFGLPVGDDMEGKPLVAAFERPPAIETIPSWDDVPGDDGQHPAGFQLDPFESKAALDQLVALGYIEPPGENQEKAVKNTVRELNYNLAQAYMDAGRSGDAEPLLEVLYSQYPLEFRFAVKLAICYRTLDRTEKLAPLVQELNTTRRRQAEAARERLKEFGEVARQRNQARRDQQAKGTSDTENADALLLSVNNNQPAGTKEPTFNEQERAAIRELRALAHVNLAAIDCLAGFVHVAEGNPEQAIEQLMKAEQAEVPRPELHLQIGEAWLKLKRWLDAERSFAKAGELDPENAHVHMGLCRSLLGRRQNRAAVSAALKAIGLRYHFPMAHYCLGVALRRIGKADRAVEAFEIALSQNPNFAEAHRQLAEIYKKPPADLDKSAEHRRLAREIREQNRQRKAENAGLPQQIPVDINASLPKVPDVEPAKPQQKPAAIDSVLRLRHPPAQPAVEPLKPERSFVTIVTGLPRSGTSMMMQMLNAAGLHPLTDQLRQADEDNPRGYFELEAATRLRDNPEWVADAQGKLIKVVAQLVPWLPQGVPYRVVFMQRDIDEVLSSQRKMLQRQGKQGSTLPDDRMKNVFQRQLARNTPSAGTAPDPYARDLLCRRH